MTSINATTPHKKKATSAAPALSKAAGRQLDRTAWLDAAEKAIAEGGFSNARVLPLAKKLGVTRGSFYWHFDSHAAFILQIVERWKEREMQMLAKADIDTSNPVKAIEQIVDLTLQTSVDYRQVKVDFALRNYAVRNKLAAKSLAIVDRDRVKYLSALFKAMTATEEEAESQAILFYAQLIGTQLISLYTAPKHIPATVTKLKQAISATLGRLQSAHH